MKTADPFRFSTPVEGRASTQADGHEAYVLHGTDTGRFSSRRPNASSPGSMPLPNWTVVMAASKDGFFCKGPDDDMSWTGPEDKALFRMMTQLLGPTLLAGATTAKLMPRLSGREIIALSRGSYTDPERALEHAARLYPNAVLIGGPTIVAAALRRRLVARMCINIIMDAQLWGSADGYLDTPVHSMATLSSLAFNHGMYGLSAITHSPRLVTRLWRRNA